MQIYKRKSHKKIIITCISIALLIMAAGLTYAARESLWPKTTESAKDKVNYSPPTSEQQKDGETTKQASNETLSESNTVSPADDTTKKNVAVFITDASQYQDMIEIRSYVNSIVNTGQCTVTLRQDTATITRNTPILDGPSTSPCKTVTIPLNDFNSSGNWTVSVSYSSDSLIGKSNSTTIDIKK